jgi:hypothetical protein
VGDVLTHWRSYESTTKRPQPKHAHGPFLTARQLAIHDALSPEDREEIHEEAKAYAAAVMARFERDRRRR